MFHTQKSSMEIPIKRMPGHQSQQERKRKKRGKPGSNTTQQGKDTTKRYRNVIFAFLRLNI